MYSIYRMHKSIWNMQIIYIVIGYRAKDIAHIANEMNVIDLFS